MPCVRTTRGQEVRAVNNHFHAPSPATSPTDPMPAAPSHTPPSQKARAPGWAKHRGGTYTQPLTLLRVPIVSAAERRPPSQLGFRRSESVRKRKRGGQKRGGGERGGRKRGEGKRGGAWCIRVLAFGRGAGIFGYRSSRPCTAGAGSWFPRAIHHTCATSRGRTQTRRHCTQARRRARAREHQRQAATRAECASDGCTASEDVYAYNVYVYTA